MTDEEGEMTVLEGLLSQPGGMALVMDLIMAGEREPGETMICDFLPGMRAEYDRVVAILDEEIEKEKFNEKTNNS